MSRSMGISPEFMHGVVMVCSQPPILIDVALNVFFPEIAAEQQRFMSMQLRPSAAIMYDWLQEKFPTAPLRQPEDIDAEKMLREMLKHIVAKAFNMKYESPGRIISPLN
jgi:hypothetical protein